ncbi:MAG: hypothetical protein ACI4VB_04770 [Bradymonadia bacterium]
MPANGFKPFLIPLLLATLLILFMLAMGRESQPYATDVDAYTPVEGPFRIEGTLHAFETYGASFRMALCGAQRCVEVEVPARFASRLKPGLTLVVWGSFQNGVLRANRVVSRCHSPETP